MSTFDDFMISEAVNSNQEIVRLRAENATLRAERDALEDADKRAQEHFEAWEQECEANRTLRAELERLTTENTRLKIKEIAADVMAKVADDWVERKQIDARSALADARLNYGNPYVYESALSQAEATVARLTGERDAALRKPVKLAVPFQKELTVILIKNTSDAQADTDLATIADGKATVFRVGVPELYFHQLRLRVLKDASLKSKIAVFYLDENSKIWPIEDIENQLRWPVGFMEEIWHKEMDIQELKRPGLAESIRTKKGEDEKLRTALSQAQQALRLRDRILEMMKKRDWSTHWIHRSAYLHLESAELAEAVRGKHGDPLEESADVLITLLALSPHDLPQIVSAAERKVETLMTKPRYVGETGTFGDGPEAALPSDTGAQAQEVK